MVTVLVLTLVQTFLPVTSDFGLPTSQAAQLYENRGNFQQWTTWQGVAANHVPYKTSAGTAEITSNSDAINLTQDAGSQSGFLWNTQTYSYAQDLSVSANIYLGAKDGADGLMFSMRPLDQWPNDGVSGSTTGGAGFWATGEVRAFLDTWQNEGERAEDHLRVQAVTTGGVEKTYTSTGVLLKNASGTNITDVENNQFYPFTFRWTASSRTFSVFSGLSANHLIYSTVITNAEMNATQFAWGWAGFTGGASNFQAVTDVSYHVGPTVTSSDTNRTVGDGSSVTLSASVTSSETSPTRRWEYSTNGGSTWISTGVTNTTYTFTATRALTQRQYRFYVESTAVGITYSNATTPITLTVLPPALRSESDTAVNTSGTQFFYADAADSILPGVLSTVTLEAWVNPSATCDGTYFCSILASNNSFILDVYQGKVAYIIGSGAAWCDSGSVTYVANGFVPSGRWSHVAMVRNSANVKIYVNGNLVSDVNSSCVPTSLTAPANQQFGIGYRQAHDQFFYGSIDEVRIWTTDRSASISSDMHSNETSTSGLRNYWNFNEGTGGTAYNQVPSATSSSDLISFGSTKDSPSFWDADSISSASTSGPYSIRTFKRSFITAGGGWKVPSGVTRVTALVAAGGGGGAGGQASEHGGGGGGAGGVLTSTITLASGFTSITVGSGGSGGTSGKVGTNGTNSSLGGAITSLGGGRGGTYFTDGPSIGGSGGGAGSSETLKTGAVGTSGQGNKGGNVTSNTTNNRHGGGGGGAGGLGGNTVSASNYTVTAGSGGIGIESSITGTAVYYGGGGGGGGSSGNGGGPGATGGATGGLGGGGNGATYNGSSLTSAATSGASNTGGGGGGGIGTGGANASVGAAGGSGIIVIRWITATAPIFTGPASDTLTAGMVETFTVSGSPVSPLTRNYRWQVSTDTGSTWVNATTGTGFTSANYTTPTLETTTSGIRYQYRVVVTDSDTAGLFIVETSTATVFLTINPRITITGSSVSLTQKYGDTQTVTYTIANGTGTRTTVASPNNRTGITWSSVSGSAATLAIGAGLGFGTYYETLTVTDSVTATTTQMVTISISKADTITVTLDTITALTYTGTNALVNPKMNISGLKSTDSATAEFDYTGTTLTYNVSSGTRTCAQGGTCSIGDSAPGGGKVFYVSATTLNAADGISSGGIYLATGPDNWWTSAGISSYAPTFGCASVAFSGTYTDTIGSGAENTRQLMTNSCAQNAGSTPKNISTTTFGGYSDWFVPSMAELQVLYTNLYAAGRATVPAPGWSACAYWSSNPVDASFQKVLYVSCNGLGGTISNSGKGNSSGQGAYAMPIRAFSPIPSSGSSAPTNAGNYTVLPVNFVMTSPATLSNYQGVTITGRNFTIDKAYQAKLSIGQYDAFPGISSYPLNVYGGSGSGTLTRTLVDIGTANCALSGTLILSASNVGTCTVRAVKDGGINYFTETTTAIIYWMNFINRYTSSGPTTPTDLGLSGSTGFEKRTYETFTVLSFANGSGSAVTSVAKGSVMRVIGTGFNSSDETTEVIIGFFSIPKSSLTFNTTNPLANYVEFTVPNSSDLDAGANDVGMKSRKGWAYAPSQLNVTG
jgi:hypothetical protein